jgi:hypothetical protein
MLYFITGITPTQLHRAVQHKLLPSVQIGELLEEGQIRLEINATEELATQDVQEYRDLLKEAKFPLPERPYTKNPIDVYLQVDQAGDETPIMVYELHNYARGALERLVSELREAGFAVSWEKEEEVSIALSGGPDPEWIIPGHNYHCTCLACSLVRVTILSEEGRNRQKELGWIGEVVSGDSQSPTGFNAHTHMDSTLGHPDFQIVVPLSPPLINHLFHCLVEQVKAGRKLRAGEIIPEMIETPDGKLPISLLSAFEGDREVLRIIIPDLAGNVTLEAMQQQARRDDDYPIDLIRQFEVGQLQPAAA